MEYPIHSVVMHITTGVCRIQDIQEKQFTEDQHQKYYVLQPIFEKGTTLFVPIENAPVRIRPLLTKEAITELLHELSAQEDEPWIHNQHQRTAHFKTILKNGNEQEILSMLHMMQKHRKLPIVEERMRQTAKKLVEQEFSYVLGMKPETVPAWIRAQLQQR